MNGELIQSMEEIISVSDPERAKAVLIAEVERRKVVKWTCKDGSLINVKEMNDYHLQNAIAMCNRLIAEREQAFQRADMEADYD